MRPHRRLFSWQESVQFVKDIYLLTRLFPGEEKFGIVAQFRRAAISIALNISEGAARQSDKEFVRFLFIAEGSSSEVDTLLEICCVLGYINQEKLKFHLERNERISALIRGLRKSIEERLK